MNNLCIYADILSPIIRQISKAFRKVIVMSWTGLVIEHLMKDYGWPRKYRCKQFTCAFQVEGVTWEVPPHPLPPGLFEG